MKMQWLRRISRSVNHRGEFNVLFSKEHRTLGCDPRFFSLDENTIHSSRSVVGSQDATRSFALSRTFARDFGTCAQKEPPQPRRIPIVFGMMLRLMMAEKELHEYVDRKHRELGPIFKAKFGTVWTIYINSPDVYQKIFNKKLEGSEPKHYIPDAWKLYNKMRALRRGLLFTDGEEWYKLRSPLNRIMLTSASTDLINATCQEAAENLTKKWTDYSRAGSTIPNVELQLYEWTIETMLAILVGSRWRDCKSQMHHEVKYLAEMVYPLFRYTATLSMTYPKLAKILRLSPWTKYVENSDAIMAKLPNLIEEMIRLKSDGLLQMMIENEISEDDAIRIAIDFIIAAGDTTALSMQWALLLLSNNFKLQDQLYHKIKDMSTKEILRYQLLKGVRKEALRLYPVAPFLNRYLAEDATFDDYSVSKGDLISMSLYSSSRDENNFPEPNEFWPERWLRTKDGNLQGVSEPYASLPFALGARSCIGQKLAETKMTLALAQLIKNFKIECENRDSIEMICRPVAVPSQPILFKLTDRKA